MNSFARFGIDHLSPSSLNLWRGAPGLWALKYIGRLKDDGNPGMWRGTAVEAGLAAWLRAGKWDQAVNVANDSFAQNNVAYDDSNEIEAERNLIMPMLEVLTKWQPPGALNATQIRVEYWLEHIPIPIVGFIDMAFEGRDIDLKTTKAIPSTPRPDNARQVSLYRAARNRAGGLLYVSSKRHAYYEINDELMNECIADLNASALSLNNYLARMDSREDALRSLPLDYDHYAAPKTKMPLSEILGAG